jgi:hypothetical protein
MRPGFTPGLFYYSELEGNFMASGPQNNRGLSKTPTYLSWNAMRRRCHLGSTGKRTNYAGISVCLRWEIYENFVEDMGLRPEGTTLDRIDPYQGYTPENCRWVNASIQQRNKRNNRTLTYMGETLTLADWEEKVGIGRATLNARLNKYGWTPEETLFTPVGEKRKNK